MPHKLKINLQEYLQICDSLKEIDSRVLKLNQMRVHILNGYGLSRESFNHYKKRYAYYTEDNLTEKDLKYIKDMDILDNLKGDGQAKR